MFQWVRDNLVLIGVVALVAIFLISWFIAFVKGRESIGRRAAAMYANIRESSVATLVTFFLGLLISLVIGVLFWRSTVFFLGLLRPPGEALHFFLQNSAGVIVGIMVGLLVFLPGFFTIRAGQKAFLTLFGIPFGRLGPGWGWHFPGLMTVKIVDAAAMQDRSDAAEEYSTGDGIEIFVESEITVAVEDPLLVQGILEVSVPVYITARRKAAVRKYVGTLTVARSLSQAMKEDASIDDQVALFDEIRTMKGEISTNGPGTILGFLNEELPTFGLRAKQVEVENVRFNDRLESRSQRIFDEIAEALGLRKDALNKALNAKTFREALLRDNGINVRGLSRADKLRLMRGDVAFALAAEGQGSYHFYDFGSPPVPGVIVNTTPPTGGTNGHPSNAPNNDNDPSSGSH